MANTTASDTAQALLNRVERVPGWEAVLYSELREDRVRELREQRGLSKEKRRTKLHLSEPPKWFQSVLTSVALLAADTEPHFVTGQNADGASILYIFTRDTIVTLDVGNDADEPSTTVTAHPRSGLRSVQVESDESITSRDQDYWPGEVRVLGHYDDGRAITLTRHDADNREPDDLVAFLPNLLSDLGQQDVAQGERNKGKA
jgi:hypothetical protein